MKSHVCQWPPPFHLARSEPTCSSVWRQSSEHWATRSCASSSRLGRRKDHALERATGCGNNFYVRKFQVKEVWTEQFVPAETSQKSVDCVDFQTSSLIEQSLENSELQEFDENSIFEDCGGYEYFLFVLIFSRWRVESQLTFSCLPKIMRGGSSVVDNPDVSCRMTILWDQALWPWHICLGRWYVYGRKSTWAVYPKVAGKTPYSSCLICLIIKHREDFGFSHHLSKIPWRGLLSQLAVGVFRTF